MTRSHRVTRLPHAHRPSRVRELAEWIAFFAVLFAIVVALSVVE